MKQNYIEITPNFNIIQSMLLELLKEGVMLISPNLQPIYLNTKAKEICHRLGNSNYQSDTLPPVISDIYRQIIRNFSSEDRFFIMDYEITGEQNIRIRADYLPSEMNEQLNINAAHRPWLLLLLEDRNATLYEELRMEQKKYNLTDRELEVFSLLSQSYSYQKIANRLHVSINTVKYHVKNINIKKENILAEKQFLKIS